ncbi:hypothetical protein E9993_21615 [Labilibacter sediminis]|nr:hypothetical protein E9993_21615 [Labilibacter sediminis]
MRLRAFIFIGIFIVVFCSGLTAQNYSNKVTEKRKQEIIDSLKNTDYPYLLPILGDKVTKLGFDIPYSAGLSVQYVNQKSDILISDLHVGFNHGQMFGIDEIVRFDKATALSNAVNFRPDLWIFPFLNVYGIYARSQSETNVGFGMYMPGNFTFENEELNWDWVKVMDAETTAKFEATTFGFGITPTVGVAGGFFALDMNWTWSDIPELDDPAKIFIFGPRFGKTFQFKKPQSNIAVWVGGFRVKMGGQTDGSLILRDLWPEMDSKIEGGQEKIADAQQTLNDWWDGLTPQEKIENLVKKEAAEAALNLGDKVLDTASRAETVQYSLDKRQRKMWNFIVGSQYQYNKNLMFRFEAGMLGSRTQYIGGIQYRFGL